MPTRLLPPEDKPELTAKEICRRIKDEFDHVELDATQGQDQVGSMIETFVRLKAPKAILDFHTSVRDTAVHVWISDDPTDELAYVSFVAMDGGDVFIGYSSQQHEDRARPIVKRCQTALGYDWMDQ
jgi:trehalose-6-phosphatase